MTVTKVATTKTTNSPYKNSREITTFLDYIDEISKHHGYLVEALEECNKKQQDLLHAIEMNEDGYKARNKMAAQLETCRKERRWYKDRVEESNPVVSFLADPHNKAAINKLKNVLGQVKKAERQHEVRTYCPRSLSPEIKRWFL